MSFNGIYQFNQNLLKVMDSEAYKKGDFAQKMNIGYRLLESKYGFRTGLFGKVKKL